MSSNLEEGITPAELGGMGPVQLPTDTQLGSGDIPSGIKSEEDDEDEKKKLKEMEGKQIHTSFNDFVSEARDLNDPMAMRLRAAKSKANKKKSEPAKKEMSPAKAKKLAKLQDERAQIMRDMEQEAEMEGGEVADKYGNMLNKIDKKIAKLQESVETTDVILEMDSEGIQSLADELSAEVYTARLKDGAKSATIKATTTTKTWDDGAPILKFLARGKAKSMPFALYQRPFTVLHDVAHGWFYFTDGRKWYGLHGDEGYSEPEDLPFDMEISESIVSERYTKSAGYKAAVDRIEGLSRQLDPMSRLCKGISKGADNVAPEFKEMEKHMEEIISIWNEIEMIIDMNESTVTEGYGEFIKAKNLTDIVNLSKEKKRAIFYVTDDNNSRIGAFYLKNGKFAKATSANPSYDLQNNKTTLRDRSDVIYKYKVDESLVTEALSTAQKKRLSEYLDNLEFDDLWEISDFVGQQETEIGLEDLPEWKKLQNTKSIKKLRQFAFDHMLKNNLTVKDLKEAGILESVSTDDVNEARSINKIQKEYSKVVNDMAELVTNWKAAKESGDEKAQANFLARLKELTAKKKALMSELDAAVGIKDLNIELAD